MKRVSFIVVLTLILTTACRKEFIELTPVSTVSVDVLYKTDKDIGRYIKMHVDDGLQLLNEEVNSRSNIDGFDFLTEKINLSLNLI